MVILEDSSISYEDEFEHHGGFKTVNEAIEHFVDVCVKLAKRLAEDFGEVDNTHFKSIRISLIVETSMKLKRKAL